MMFWLIGWKMSKQFSLSCLIAFNTISKFSEVTAKWSFPSECMLQSTEMLAVALLAAGISRPEKGVHLAVPFFLKLRSSELWHLIVLIITGREMGIKLKFKQLHVQGQKCLLY